VERMACAPARVFHLPGGTLRRGSPADITVFDPGAEWEVNASRFRTKGRNTPYQGTTLTGRVHYTIVDGNVVHRGMI
jgi:dihydroorotase